MKASIIGGETRCVRCRTREAVAFRRTPSHVGTWNRAQGVCAVCRDELDDLAERLARSAIRVDRVVRRSKSRAAA